MKVSQVLEYAQEYDEYIGGVKAALATLDDQILDREVNNVANDHNRVNSKSIFVAITGTKIDSHKYIQEARNNNAALVIGENGSSEGLLADICVDSTRAILGPIASAINLNPSKNLSMVAITGTNGKTTCTYLFSSILQALSKPSFTIGTTGIIVDGIKIADTQTTPDPIIIQKTLSDFVEKNTEYGVMEVSSHALDQMRVLGVKYCAVAFTNFSQDHLDYHETMEQYFHAKSSLFTQTYTKNAVINIDDERSAEIVNKAKENNLDVLTVSRRSQQADIYIEKIDMNIDGSKLLINVKNQNDISVYECDTNLISDYNHENIAVALGLAKIFNLDFQAAVKAMENPRQVPGRLERINGQQPFSIFVDYAHTPDALKRVIETIKPLSKRLIVVFGCGGDRDRSKRPQMGLIVDRLADIAIITNDNPRSEDPEQIANEIASTMNGDYQIELDRKQAIKLALQLAQPNDTILIAGKGHESYQEFFDRKEEFSDVATVNELIKGMDHET